MYNLSKKTLLGVTFITFFMCTLFFTTPDAFATRAKKAGIKVDSLKLSAANPVFNCPDTTTVTLSIYYTVKVVSKYSVNKKLNLFYWRGNPKAESDLPGSGGGKRYIARETYTIDTDGKYKDSSYVDTVKFKIWCASCCDKGIKGNRSTANQNNKKKATLRVHFYGKKAKVTVECKHEDSHARLTPRDTLGTIGSDATCSIELDNQLNDVQDVILKTVYDNSVFNVLGGQFTDAAFAQYDTFFLIEPDTFVLEAHLPEDGISDLEAGKIAEFYVEIADFDLENIYISQFELTSNSTVINFTGEPYNIDWNIGDFLVLPIDSLDPVIDMDLFDRNPIVITGYEGAVSDSFNYLSDSLSSYTKIWFYDNEASQWLDFDVDTNGGFYTDEIWLLPSNEIDLIAYDLAANADTSVMTTRSHSGYVWPGVDTSSSPGDTVPVEFNLYNWSYTTHGYFIVVTDNQGWDLSPQTMTVELDSMQETTFTIDVTIPSGTEIGTIDWIYLTATSQDDPSITDSDSLYVEVVEYTPIPTLSEWGMIILGLLLLAAGTIAVIRRRRATTACN